MFRARCARENRSRPQPDETSVREMDAYKKCDQIPCSGQGRTLFFERGSLLIRLGNLARSACGTIIYHQASSAFGPKIAIFAAKFPVCREFARRQVRSALRRQPGSPRIAGSSRYLVRSPANGGVLHAGRRSLCSRWLGQRANSPKVSGPDWENSLFWRTGARDRVRSPLNGGRTTTTVVSSRSRKDTAK